MSKLIDTIDIFKENKLIKPIKSYIQSRLKKFDSISSQCDGETLNMTMISTQRVNILTDVTASTQETRAHAAA